LTDKLEQILTELENCRAALWGGGDRDAANLVSVAILELKMKLNRINDADLKALVEQLAVPAADEEKLEVAAAVGSSSRPIRFRPSIVVQLNARDQKEATGREVSPSKLSPTEVDEGSDEDWREVKAEVEALAGRIARYA